MSIVHDLCGLGSFDVDFIDELIEEWDIDTESLTRSIWDNVRAGDLYFDANDIIEGVYEQIADEYNISSEDWSCFVNCLDSHFYYKGEKIYCKKDLETLLENDK